MNYTELRTAVSDFCENTFTDVDFATMTQLAEQKIYNSVQLPIMRKSATLTLTPSVEILNAPLDFQNAFSLAVIDGTGAYNFLLNKDVNFIREAYPIPTSTGLPKYYAVNGPQTLLPQETAFILGPTPSAALSTVLNYSAYPTSIVSGVITSLAFGIVGGTSYNDGTYYDVPLTQGVGTGATAIVVISGGVPTTITVQTGGVGYSLYESLTILPADVGGVGLQMTATVLSVANPEGTSWLGGNFDSALFNATMVEAIRFMKGEADMVALYADAFKQSLALLKNLSDGKLRQDAYRSGQVRTQVV
jgi:hypothetical protein